MPETEHNNNGVSEYTEVSKSEVKRRMHYLQALAEQLTRLSASQLQALNLSTKLEQAIVEFGRIKKHEARRRHLQYLGKLMRKEEDATIEHIETALEKINHAHHQHVDHHRDIERLRDQMLTQGSAAIEAFVETYPTADRQWLRQICRQAAQEKERAKPPAAARKLFQYIKQQMQAE